MQRGLYFDCELVQAICTAVQLGFKQGPDSINKTPSGRVNFFRLRSHIQPLLREF